MSEGFTQVPNIIFDKYLHELKSSEFLVLMAIIRKTWGWRKKEDRISVSQICTATNLSNRTVIDCLKALEKKGIISTKKSHKRTTRIRLNIQKTSENISPKTYQSSENFSPRTSENSSHTKYSRNKYIDDSPILGGLMQFPNRPK